MKGPWQIMPLAGHRHMIFLHRLQKRRLGAWAGAIDFVSHQQLREDRSAHEAEGTLAVSRLFHDFGAQNVGWHQIGRELHPARVEAENRAQRFHQFGLGKTWHADQQAVATGDQGHQGFLDHLGLTENDRPDGGAGGGNLLQRLLSLPNRCLLDGDRLLFRHRTHCASFRQREPFLVRRIRDLGQFRGPLPVVDDRVFTIPAVWAPSHLCHRKMRRIEFPAYSASKIGSQSGIHNPNHP